MTFTDHTLNLLSRLQGMMDLNDDEIVQRGITQAATERMIELRQRAGQLKEQYNSINKLEELVIQGVSPDDHTIYTDLQSEQLSLISDGV
ncbi:MAG: hypothetical protein WCP19_11765 [Chloroflexota bacterium]